ncbi:MAG TPA: hypothetical protein VGH90_02875 [Chthoniobacteraceae bacterium]|jgi:hypothetical protein
MHASIRISSYLILAFGFFLTNPTLIAADASYLDNGIIRVGGDDKIGGAITWLSKSGSEENVINAYDWGREVQMSYYGGPVPFIPEGKEVAPNWRALGWNPIQAGDAFGHRSKILEQTNDGRVLYVKCTPMQWPLNDVPGECTFESWLELDGATVRARCRLTNHRADRQQYDARTQEMPAVYTNAAYFHIVTYKGDHPFAGEAPDAIVAKQPPAWSGRWLTTERWSALVNDAGWGLGVWSEECCSSIGGFAGKPGVGDTHAAPCGYLAPVREEILDADIVHEYHYELTLGTVAEIRARAAKHPHESSPTWRFTEDRQGWWYHGAHDAGWPIHGELVVSYDKGNPQIRSPIFFCQAAENPALIVDAAFTGGDSQVRVFWRRSSDPGFADERSALFPISSDGQFREYRFPLSNIATYSGAIVALRIDPAHEAPGEAKIRSVRLVN